MAAAINRPVEVTGAGATLYDSAVVATAVRDPLSVAIIPRMITVDSSAGGTGAAYLQLHDAPNPTLGTDYAKCILPTVASAHIVWQIGGDGTQFSQLTYCLTDAAKGSSVTGAGREVYFAFDEGV